MNLDEKSQKVAKSRKTYICDVCEYITPNRFDYQKHTTTSKHTTGMMNHIQKLALKSQENRKTQYACGACEKTYKTRSGLSYHETRCRQVYAEESDVVAPTIDTSLVIELLKQNQEFKELMMEQSKQLADQQYQNQLLLEQQHAHNSNLLEAVKDGKIGNTTNHNTNCNNKFNLNVFLNETCKDAITMEDFINSFEVTREDFLHTGQVGFVEGISTVMTHRFRDMDMHTRPLHCTDLKRETIYIKNADKWEKDDADKTHMRKAVRGVARKNMKELWRWFQDSKPEVEQIGTEECENYFQYHKAALGGYGKEEDLKFEEKIIKNVLKEVQVDKNALTLS
jgi:hypothetical protein